MVNLKAESQPDVPAPGPVPAFEPAAPQSVPIPNFCDDLPTYFPLHSSLRINTDSSHFQFLKQTDERLLGIRKVVDKFLAYVVNNAHLLQEENASRFLSTQTQAYGEILTSKLKLENVQNILKSEYRELMDRRRTEASMGLDNYHTFRAATQENFGDSLVSQLDAAADPATPFSQQIKADPTYQYLSNVGFVLENPEDPLPDDTTDDELAVSGGKISLKDPLSLDFFTEPVMSKTCKHVFEDKYIRQQLQGHAYIHCPITGCEAKVSSRDLVPDKLMELRVKVYQARVKKRESRVRI